MGQRGHKSESESGFRLRRGRRAGMARYQFGAAVGGAGLGHQSELLLFTNQGNSACTLAGYPGVAALTDRGAQAVQAVRLPNGYLGGLENSVTPPRGRRCPRADRLGVG